MKSISQRIFEASGKPSDLRKYKTNARKEMVHFNSGDIYDFSDPGYDEEFTYYDGSGNGYIKDKEGHVYDVITSTRSGDAGRIAGGSTNYYVCIKKANGTDDFVVTGYSAIFSIGSNTECVSDIGAGYYLEDYIAKYYSSYSHGEKFKELAEKGDKDAKPYSKLQQEKAASKEAEFKQRYILLPRYGIHFEINDNGFNIVDWHPGKSTDEQKSKGQQKSNTEYWTKDENGKSIKDIDSLKGISGKFVVPFYMYQKIGKNGNKHSDVTLAIDSKTKNIVAVATEVSKVIDSKIDLKLADNITINKKFMSKKMEDLFRQVAKAWKKANGGKQSQYVEDNWFRIQKEGGGYWSLNKNKSQARREAAEEYKKLVKSMDFDSNDVLTFSLALVQQYVQGDLDPELGEVEKPLEDPTPQPSKERGKDTKMSKGANKAAYQKMQDWHDGKRNQNLKNCSDAKLKMNYKVCKELGLTLYEIVLCDNDTEG